MKIKHFAFALASAISLTSHATPISSLGTWETTLSARDINKDGITDAYYDSVLNITWLADANYAKTSGWAAAHTLSKDGRLYWAAGNTWVNQLDIYGITGWRMPTHASLRSPENTKYSPANELSHLFSVTLGNFSAINDAGTAYTSCFINFGKSNCFRNTGLFLNTNQADFWYGNYAESSFPFYFSSSIGAGGWLYPSEYFQVWAVHNGDIMPPAPVPEPASIALVLLSLGVLSRIRKKNHG
jgi:hypothetical protein